MNTFKVLGLTATLALTLGSCNNSGTNTTSTDSTNRDSSTTNTVNTSTSTTNYSAMADTMERNSQSGYYLNPKTGKPLHVKMDRSTGRISDAESNTPVNRFVDKRTWRVYGGNNWDSIGSAKMQGDNLMYQDQTGNWVNYDKRWKEEDMKDMNTNNTNTTNSSSTDSGMNNNNSSMDNSSGSSTDNTSNGGKMSTDHNKVKVRDHGNKVKIKEKD